MKVTVTSDTHGRRDMLEKLMKWEPDSDLFVHCGDLEDDPALYPGWIFVQGNNDYYGSRDNMPADRIISAGGHRILVTHSHRYGYRNRAENLAKKAREYGCDIVLYGHTHIADHRKVDGITLINPGSAWMSRDQHDPSYAILNLEPGKEPEVTFKEEPEWPDYDPNRKHHFWDWF